MEKIDLIKSVRELDDFMTTPDKSLIEMMRKLQEDIMILGAGGKMGISMAVLAKRAADAVGNAKKIIAVSRFSNTSAREELTKAGVETISSDLMNESDLQKLPDVKNIVFLMSHLRLH